MTTFTLADSSGKPHEYKIHPHPAGEGTRLVITLMGLAGEPLGRVLNSNLAGFIGKFQSGEVDLDSQIGVLMQDIDFSSVARDLRLAFASLDSLELFQNILKYTHRDGFPLAESGHYDSAFQKNYGELLKAVWKVIQVNDFLGSIGSLMKS